MRIDRRQIRRLILESLEEAWAGRKDPYTGRGGPSSVEEWTMWGETFGLTPEYDPDGQLIFYLSPNQRDRDKVAAEALKAGANVDTAPDGKDFLYTSMTDMGPMGARQMRMI